MKKFINIFLAVLITLFSFPFGGLNVSAAEKTYDDIEDGEYNLTAKLLQKGTQDESAAADFMSDEVKLTIEDGEVELIFFIPQNEMMSFNSFKIENQEAKVNDDKDPMEYTFVLDELKEHLSAMVSYEVPLIGLVHDNVEMDIQLVGLDDLPKVEEEEEEVTPEEPEKPEVPEEDNDSNGEGSGEDSEDTDKPEEDNESEDENNNGSVDENESDSQELDYAVDVAAMERYIEAIELSEVDGKNEVTFHFNSQEYIDNFEIVKSDEFVEAENVVVDGDNVAYTFEIADLSKTLATKITIDAMGREMVHEFNVDFRDYKVAKQLEYTVDVAAMERYMEAIELSEVGGKNEVTFHFNSQEYIDNFEIVKSDEFVEAENVVIDGDNVAYTFEIADLSKTLATKITIDAMGREMVHEFNVEFTDYKVEDSEENEGNEEDGSEEEDETNGEATEDDEKIENPDKAYEIDYTILNENGKDASVADGFFIKPGILLEKDNKTYFHLTVESAEMVKTLSNKYGDYVLVDEKDGSKTMQLRVPNNLSDSKLDMHIVVPSGVIPGFPGYDSEHQAILTFDKDSKKEIDVNEPTPTPDPTPEPGKDNGEGQDKTNNKKPSKENEEVTLTPEKAYEINYTILHEDGSAPSVADGFFKKPGTLLEYDGKTYFQMTVESAEMVKALSNQYGDYILVSKNADGTMTIQLRVPNDLSDMKLDMHIVVPAGAIPGFPGYDEKHGAILTFDKDSKKEISVDGLEVAASGDKNNENGPYVEGATPGKPSFDDNNSKDGGQKAGANGNPKTGDTSQILFFTMLLISSLGVLAFQLRRRIA